jgi:hypothetical protein
MENMQIRPSQIIVMLGFILYFPCFFSSSRNRVCVSESQTQFPVFQFTIQISFQDGGYSMSDYFSFKQFLHLSCSEFYRVFLWILDLSYSALSWRFFCGNAISGSLSFSNFIRYRLSECKQCCLRL